MAGMTALERYLKWLYWAGAAGLAPWTVYLYFSQVPTAVTHQVHVLAVGILVALMLGVLVTAWTHWRGSCQALMAASFTAAATFISAWFRGLTRSGGSSWSASMPAFLAVAAVIVVLCAAAIKSELAARSDGRGRIRWLPPALGVAALALVPSLVIVLVAVPPVQVAHHLRLAWTGLDVCELVALAATGLALHRRSPLAVIPATVTGALLLCDAWINIIPTTGMARAEAIVLAFVEVPLAAVSFWVAARSARAFRASPAVGAARGAPARRGA
ncbi:MAG TPA: hypothetical protein VK586_07830 [Streptosporangiaceae bacterium]|nr:hypothetical protein [Streptosporangiaceae bacterium]